MHVLQVTALIQKCAHASCAPGDGIAVREEKGREGTSTLQHIEAAAGSAGEGVGGMGWQFHHADLASSGRLELQQAVEASRRGLLGGCAHLPLCRGHAAVASLFFPWFHPGHFQPPSQPRVRVLLLLKPIEFAWAFRKKRSCPPSPCSGQIATAETTATQPSPAFPPSPIAIAK